MHVKNKHFWNICDSLPLPQDRFWNCWFKKKILFKLPGRNLLLPSHPLEQMNDLFGKSQGCRGQSLPVPRAGVSQEGWLLFNALQQENPRERKDWVCLALVLAFLHSKLSEAQPELGRVGESRGELRPWSVLSFWRACRKDHVKDTQKLRRMQTPGKNAPVSSPAFQGMCPLEGSATAFLFTGMQWLFVLPLWLLASRKELLSRFSCELSRNGSVKAIGILKQPSPEKGPPTLRNSYKWKGEWASQNSHTASLTC